MHVISAIKPANVTVVSAIEAAKVIIIGAIEAANVTVISMLGILIDRIACLSVYEYTIFVNKMTGRRVNNEATLTIDKVALIVDERILYILIVIDILLVASTIVTL